MPIFEYKALDASGKTAKGNLEADSAKTARQKLKKQGLMVTEIGERTAAKSNSGGGAGFAFGGKKVKVQQVAMLTRQLASLIRSNIPLVEALQAMVDQSEHVTLKTTLSQIRQDVNEGTSLARALAKHPRIFDHIFVNMVEAGESSGTLGQVLIKLADLKEAQMRLRSKIISGMTYPAIMMLSAVVLLIGIFGFVIPKLAKIFESMNKPIPAITKAVMAFSDLLIEWWWALGIGTFLIVYFFRKWKDSPKGRAKWDAFKLRAPIAGELIRAIAVTRFASTMSTLLASGVPILTAMNLAKNLVGNTLIQNALNNARENITEGQSIADPLKRSGQFPPLVIHMIAIGEKTGELPDMMETVARTYEQQVNSTIERLVGSLEPLMIVGMGLMVAFIVLAVFIPLLDMSSLN